MSSAEQVDGPLTYRFGPGTLVTEIAPEVCKNGHPLGPGLCTVGWSAGRMSVSCRTYTCNRCWDEQMSSHTTYLLPPLREELMQQWRAWREQSGWSASSSGDERVLACVQARLQRARSRSASGDLANEI